MATDRKRNPVTTRQANTPANPDPNADQPIIVAVPQAPHDPTHDVVDFPPTYPRGVIVGDVSVLGLTDDGAEQADSVSWALASPDFSQTAGEEAGWRIRDNGDAEFNNVTVRGTVAASSIVANTSVNLCPNGTFETDISGWTAGTNCSIARETVSPTGATSAACLKITPTATGDCDLHTPTGTDGIPCEPNTVYQVQRYVISEFSARGTHCYLTFYDVDGNILTRTEPDVHGLWIEAGPSWERSNPFSYLSPDDAAYMTINVAIIAADEYHAIDDVTIYKSSYMEGGMIIVPRIATGLYDLENTGIELDADGTMVMLVGDTDCVSPGEVYVRTTSVVTDAARQAALGIAAPNLASGDDTAYLELRSTQSNAGTTYRRGLYLYNADVTTSDASSYATRETTFGGTSSFTASVTDPTGQTWDGFFIRFGKHVEFWINTGFGAGAMTAGSGEYRFALPLSVDSSVNPTQSCIGTAICRDVSTTTNVVCAVQIQSASTDTIRLVNSSGSNQVSAVVPFAWASSDTIWIHGSYITDA